MGSVIRMFDREKARSQPRRRTQESNEVRYRYPAHEEIAEISYCPGRREAAQKRPRESRRAS